MPRANDKDNELYVLINNRLQAMVEKVTKAQQKSTFTTINLIALYNEINQIIEEINEHISINENALNHHFPHLSTLTFARKELPQDVLQTTLNTLLSKINTTKDIFAEQQNFAVGKINMRSYQNIANLMYDRSIKTSPTGTTKEKTTGVNDGGVYQRISTSLLAPDKDYMLKYITKRGRHYREELRDNVREYIGGSLYEMFLYSRTPKISLGIEKKYGDITIHSRYLEDPAMLFNVLGSSYKRKINGFEKVLAASHLLGENDYHAGNIMLQRFPDGTEVLSKIDHGRSFVSFPFHQADQGMSNIFAQITSFMYKPRSNGTVRYDKNDHEIITLDIEKYLSALKKMTSSISDEQIEDMIRSKIQDLVQSGVNLNNMVTKGNAPLDRRSNSLFSQEIDSVLAKERVSSTRLNREERKECKARLELIKKELELIKKKNNELADDDPQKIDSMKFDRYLDKCKKNITDELLQVKVFSTYFTHQVKKNIDGAKKTIDMLEVINKYTDIPPKLDNPPGSFKEFKWMQYIANSNCRDPIEFAIKYGIKIDNKYPIIYKHENSQDFNDQDLVNFISDDIIKNTGFLSNIPKQKAELYINQILEKGKDFTYIIDHQQEIKEFLYQNTSFIEKVIASLPFLGKYSSTDKNFHTQFEQLDERINITSDAIDMPVELTSLLQQTYTSPDQSHETQKLTTPQKKNNQTSRKANKSTVSAPTRSSKTPPISSSKTPSRTPINTSAQRSNSHRR